MEKKESVVELQAKAAKYRAIARQSNDEKAAHEIFALAAEIEQKARDTENGK